MLFGVDEFVRVFLDHKDELADHVGLRSINILMLALGKGGLTLI
jgi:hypothetical protein